MRTMGGACPHETGSVSIASDPLGYAIATAYIARPIALIRVLDMVTI